MTSLIVIFVLSVLSYLITCTTITPSPPSHTDSPITMAMWTDVQRTVGNLRHDVTRIGKERERDRSMMKNMDKRMKSLRANLSKMGNQVTRLQKRVNEKIINGLNQRTVDTIADTQSKLINDVELYKQIHIDVYNRVQNVGDTLKVVNSKINGVVGEVNTLSDDVIGMCKHVKDVTGKVNVVTNDVVVVRKEMMNVKNDVGVLQVKGGGIADDVSLLDDDVVNLRKRLKETNVEIGELRMDMMEMYKELVEDDGDGFNDETGRDAPELFRDLKRSDIENVDVSSGDGINDEPIKQSTITVELGGKRVKNDKRNNPVTKNDKGKGSNKTECSKWKKLRRDVKILKKAMLERDLQTNKTNKFSLDYDQRLRILENNNDKDILNTSILTKIYNYVNTQINLTNVQEKSKQNSQILSQQSETILQTQNTIKQVEVRVLECNNNFLQNRERHNRLHNWLNNSMHAYTQQFKKSVLEKIIATNFDQRMTSLNTAIAGFSNRLAHVEVKVLNETLKTCQKDHVDFYQDLKLREQDQLMAKLQEKNIQFKQAISRMDRGLYRLHVDIKENRKSIDSVAKQNKKVLTYAPQLQNLKEEVRRFQHHLPKDCSEVKKQGLYISDCSEVKKRRYNTSGIYVIHPTGTEYSASVYCEITTTDVWTVIQRRYDGNVPFSKTWKQYKSGFGSLKREFWLGNEVVHDLTSQRKYSLRVEMYDLAGTLWTADYTDFSISDEASFYCLYVTGYTGNSSDSLADSNGMAFSTEDKDNDLSSTHCGLYYTAGWWYRHCHYCNLNGRYNVGVIWFDEVKNDWVQMARTVMKIRPKHDD